MRHGLVDLAPLGQEHAKVIVDFRVVRLDFQGLPIMFHRRVRLAPNGQNGAQGMVGLAILALQAKACVNRVSVSHQKNACRQAHAISATSTRAEAMPHAPWRPGHRRHRSAAPQAKAMQSPICVT